MRRWQWILIQIAGVAVAAPFVIFAARAWWWIMTRLLTDPWGDVIRIGAGS